MEWNKDSLKGERTKVLQKEILETLQLYLLQRIHLVNIYIDVREMAYKDFDDIIIDHLGEDVSELISNVTISKFAVN